MHSKSNNIKFTSYNNENEVVDKLFVSFRSKCQGILETSMRRNYFIVDSIQLMYYKFHDVNFRRGGSYIDSPEFIRKEKVTKNKKNEDDKCFQYSVTVAIIYGEAESHPE